MKSMPKLSHLTTFKEIVYCGSLHETSKKLAISQPTLSRIIKELEENIGSRLLERSNRGVRLTAVGEAFFQRIDAITNELRNTIYEFRGLKETGEKFLRLGMSTYPLLCYLPDALEIFNQRYPHSRIIVIEDCPEGLVAKLRNNELDLVVCNLSEGINCVDLVTQDFKCETFSLYQGNNQSSDELPLDETKWVVPHSCTAGRLAMQDSSFPCTQQGHVVETDSFLATWCLVKQQGYLALLSDRIVAHYSPQVNLKKKSAEDINISACFYIIKRDEPMTSSITSDFTEILMAM
ncbi:LysR family transcriptional regulator [Serratia sp. T13T92]|uniref:LysR family transcriptional regulator n=1 Tax=Serratia sp. T13T92 TaxID=3397496 RepID=UPI0039DF3599